MGYPALNGKLNVDTILTKSVGELHRQFMLTSWFFWLLQIPFMLLGPVWPSVASKLGSHGCHCFGMSWAIFMLDRKTYDRKSQPLCRFHASALCEYYRLPSYSKHYFSGQCLPKTTFLVLLGWKYSHAFIQSHVADKTSPYCMLFSLLSPCLFFSSRNFCLLPSLVSPLPRRTRLFDGSSLSCSHLKN